MPVDGSLKSPLFTAVVRYTRSRQTMGDDQARPGRSTTQATFFVVDHSVGRVEASATPAPAAPLNCGQSVLDPGASPRGPPTRSLAGAPWPRSVRVARSLGSLAGPAACDKTTPAPTSTRTNTAKCFFMFTLDALLQRNVELPAVLLPQSGDVRRVMTAMPRVEIEQVGQRHRPVFRVHDFARERRRIERPQEVDPARVDVLDQRQRYGDRGRLAIDGLGPQLLVVRLDRRIVLGHAQLEADVRVHVAVRDVVHDLPRRPSAVAVWRIKLLLGQSLHRGREAGRGRGDLVDELRRFSGRLFLPLADGITGIVGHTGAIVTVQGAGFRVPHGGFGILKYTPSRP